MEAFSVGVEERDGCAILHLHGYFDGAAGQALEAELDRQLRGGRVRIVFDFAPCQVVSSPGVASMVELAVKVCDDFQGRLVLCGLDALKLKVFTLAGILDMCAAAPGVAEAVAQATAA